MQSQKIMSIVGWVLSGLLGAALVLSAWFKFFPPEEMVKQMKDSPLLGWILIIGIGELVSAILFLVPRTAVPGTLLLSSYFGGAIVAHMMQRESILVPSIFLILTGLPPRSACRNCDSGFWATSQGPRQAHVMGLDLLPARRGD